MNTPHTKSTQALHALGQSLWLDNITRDLLNDGTLERYVAELDVTGLTSNPTIFDEAIGAGSAYDADIRDKARSGLTGEALFMELAIADLRRAADLFRPIHERTHGLDGWVSMEVSPLLAGDAEATIEAARRIHAMAERPNLYVKIPGTTAGIEAIEAVIFEGVPVNVTLLFSREQYVAAAEAYMRGLERRLAAGRHLKVSSVASVFVSRWDRAVGDRAPPDLKNRLGIAIGGRTYRAYRDLLDSARWRALAAAGAAPQRLLWASTGVKDKAAPPDLYVSALAAPDTIDTMPEKTLLAYAERGRMSAPMARDGAAAEETLRRFTAAGIDLDALATQLQVDGAQSFVKSWTELLDRIADKGAALATT